MPLEPIVPGAKSVVRSAGCVVPSLVDVAGVVAHKVPASCQAGRQDVGQVAVGGEGSGGEGQGGAGELCLSFTFLLAFAQITGENGTSGCRTVKAVACLEDPEAIVGCVWTCWIWRGGRSTWVVRAVPAGGARRPEEMLKKSLILSL